MGDAMEPELQSTDAATGPRTSHRGFALLALALLADVLFYDQPIGLSLAIFAAAIAITLHLITGHRDRWSMALLTLAALPVIEDLNPLSATILTLGVIVFALRAHRGSSIAWAQLPLAVAAFAAQALPRTAIDTPVALRHLRQHLPTRPKGLRHNWAMPLGLGLCFAILLTLSNPILQTQAERLLTIDLAPGKAARHVAFCLAMAAATWPLLATPRAIPTIAPATFNTERLGINATSVSHALILFNALFAVQTALDLTYLWAGTTLPHGMTPATYAHRGAYPLLATALLAGAFTLISRPFAHGRLRILLLLWIAQNVLLVISALYRLDLYIQTFGLTYLRLSAAIWMALVAAGLALTAWQILRQHGNAWLLLRCTLLGIATLYACAFINFAHIIASVNLSRPSYDRAYLCNLGPNATAAIRAHELLHPRICWTDPFDIAGWRDWGFRTARVQGYLAAHPLPGPRT
jgi:Domain of unknown function (DUF4173)